MRRRLLELADRMPAAHRPRPLRAGLAALAALAALLVVAYAGWRPWHGEGRTFRVAVASADQLTAGRTPVRVAGVDVGTVSAVERPRDGQGAVVVVELDDADLDVRRDARAHVRLRTLVGGTRYIDLDPGSAAAPPLGEDVLPLARTTTQTDWDDITQVFESDVREGQRRVFEGLREGLAAPEETARTLTMMGPRLDVVGRAARASRGEREDDLRRLVTAAGQVVRGVTRHEGALERLVDHGARALRVTDRHRHALGEAVRLSPAALASTRTTLRRVDGTLAHLDPLVADLRPGARRLEGAATRLRPALDQARLLLHDAKPLLGDLPGALRDLGGASRAGGGLLDALDPTLHRLNDDLLPWLASRDDETRLRVFEAVGPTFSVLSSAGGDFDAMGYFLHFPVTTPAGDSVLLPCGPGLELGSLRRCRAVNGLARAILGRKRP